jgi:hypothetical protein
MLTKVASPTNNWLSHSLVMSCTTGSQGSGNTIPESTFPATCAPFPVIISCYLFPAMCWRGPALRRWVWSQDTFPGSSLVGLFARIAPGLFTAIHNSLILWGQSALWLRGGNALNLCLTNSTQTWSASGSMWVHLLSLLLLWYSWTVF